MKAEETVTVVTAENFKKLPAATQKIITDLTKDLKVTGLNILNPLVENMAIIEGFKAIKYIADNEECLEQYKEAKAFIRSFRARTKEAKSDLKKPFLETGKKLDLIEKTFVNGATAVLDALDKEFEAHLAKIEADKQAAADKKNAESIQKIKDLTEETTGQQIAIQRSNLFQKYNGLIQDCISSVLEKLETYSKDALETELTSISNLTFVVEAEHLNLLLEDQITRLNENFDKTIKSCQSMLTGRIKEIDTQEKLRAEAILKKAEELVEAERPAPVPEQPTNFIVPSLIEDVSFVDAFKAVMDKAIVDIGELHTKSEKDEKAKASAVAGLQNYSLKIITYLNGN